MLDTLGEEEEKEEVPFVVLKSSCATLPKPLAILPYVAAHRSADKVAYTTEHIESEPVRMSEHMWDYKLAYRFERKTAAKDIILFWLKLFRTRARHPLSQRGMHWEAHGVGASWTEYCCTQLISQPG